MAYDRSRFKQIGDQVMSPADLKLLASVNPVYLNFQDQDQVIIAMNDLKKIWVYAQGSFKYQAYTNKHISDLITIEDDLRTTAKKTLRSKMQSGLPRFKLLNSNMNQDMRNFRNGNQFELKYISGVDKFIVVS